MSVVIGSYDAKNKFSELLSQVAHGERVTITEHGIPVALLIPVSAPKPLSPDEAVAGLLELSSQITLGADLSIRQMIDEGRQ